MLIAIVRRMYSNITLRLWEDYFESFLRFKMPNRNIMTIKSTGTINGEKGLDSLKKSNGEATIISEVAEDMVMKYIIKVALAASKTVYFTHHANTANDLVSAFVDGLINTGVSTSEDKAETEVLKALGFNLHLYKSPEGERYIERITEFVPMDDEEKNDNLSGSVLAIKNNGTTEQKMDLMLTLMAGMVMNNSNHRKYKAVDIIRYDLINKEYVVVNRISDKKKNEIMKNLLREDQEKFKDFIKKLESQIQNKKELEVS
jgi:pilus assembly protein CpaF